jgi:hypothetical protein
MRWTRIGFGLGLGLQQGGFMKFILVGLLAFPFFARAWDSTCSDMKNSSQSCFMEYNGIMEKRCEVCREGKSCFMALDGVEEKMCEAYVENKSCFMALDDADRGWCEVLKEGKSCFMALDGEQRNLCEQGMFPVAHVFWAN